MVATPNRRQAQRIQPFVAPCRYVVGEERVSAFLTDISRSATGWRASRSSIVIVAPTAGGSRASRWRCGCPPSSAGRVRPSVAATSSE